MIKQILNSRTGTAVIGFFASIWLQQRLASIRWRVQGLEHLLTCQQAGETVIIAFWHNRLLGIPAMVPQHLSMAVLKSPSRDGRLIAATVNRLGIDTIWGSSNRDATAGIRRMIRHLRQDGHVGITPDGPRGPARRAAAGAIALARLSGAPIIPVAWSTNRMRRLNSWDRLAIPGLFGHGVQVWGPALRITSSNDKTADAASTAEWCHQLEDALNQVTAAADAAFGHRPDDADSRYGAAKTKLASGKP